jgi:FdhE protein
MSQERPSLEEQISSIDASVDALKAQVPQTAHLVESFRELFKARARVREASLLEPILPPIRIDPATFRQGVPIAKTWAFLIPADKLADLAAHMLPALRPLIMQKDELDLIQDAIADRRLDLAHLTEALLENGENPVDEPARSIGVTPFVLAFVGGQIIRPFAQARAVQIGPLPDDLQWLHGYCPVCGLWPHLSFLTGEAGKRMLKCSFCSHEWQFKRTQCPACGNEDQERLEQIYSTERPYERAEFCEACNRYVVALDLREPAEPPDLDVAALGLIYLDVIMHERGARPLARTEWNTLAEEV